jgi:hypothetical protein
MLIGGLAAPIGGLFLVGASVSVVQTEFRGSGAVYWAMISQIVATFACGVFFGAAVSINLIEQPARISCGTPLALAPHLQARHLDTGSASLDRLDLDVDRLAI